MIERKYNQDCISDKTQCRYQVFGCCCLVAFVIGLIFAGCVAAHECRFVYSVKSINIPINTAKPPPETALHLFNELISFLPR